MIVFLLFYRHLSHEISFSFGRFFRIYLFTYRPNSSVHASYLSPITQGWLCKFFVRIYNFLHHFPESWMTSGHVCCSKFECLVYTKMIKRFNRLIDTSSGYHLFRHVFMLNIPCCCDPFSCSHQIFTSF